MSTTAARAPLDRVREESWGRLVALFVTAGVITFAFAAELSEQDVLGPIVGLFVLVWLVVLYFIPAFVAWKRRHHQTMAIAALNLFAGWTVVGWIGSLIWALTAVASR